MFAKMFILTLVIVLSAIIINGDPRILGGYQASEGQFPYQVSLQYASNYSHFCGGSILNSKWILTAAHCVVGKEADVFTVYVGSVLISSGGIRYNVSNVIPHQKYGLPSRRNNDIALVQLKETLKFSNTVKYILLETEDIGPTLCVASGWGRTYNISYPSEPSEHLLYVNEATMTHQQCYNIIPYTDMICSAPELGKGPCSGDSGGPLVANWKQIGITSFGIKNCGIGDPDFYTKVSTHIEWIDQTMKFYGKMNFQDKL